MAFDSYETERQMRARDAHAKRVEEMQRKEAEALINEFSSYFHADDYDAKIIPSNHDRITLSHNEDCLIIEINHSELPYTCAYDVVLADDPAVNIQYLIRKGTEIESIRDRNELMERVSSLLRS